MNNTLDIVRDLEEDPGLINNLPAICANLYINEVAEILETIKENPALIENITKETLNSVIDDGLNKGMYALFGLVSTDNGLAILQENPGLVAKITEEALNTIMLAGPAKGCNCLTSLLGSDVGLTILKSNPDLMRKIRVQEFNMTMTEGNAQGVSNLSILLASESAKEIFLQHPYLVEKVTDIGLNTVFQSIVCDRVGSSPVRVCSALLIWLIVHEESCLSTLTAYPQLLAKITSVGLNSAIENGVNKGTNALIRLSQVKNSPVILDHNQELIEKITEAGLNSITVNGMSALYQLAFPGRKILQRNPQLVAKISEKALNNILEGEGICNGESALFHMVSTVDGRDLLRNNPQLLAKITEKGLNTVLTEPPYEGQSALTCLISEKDGCAILRDNPELVAKITKEGITNALRYSNNKTISLFARYQTGKELLKNYAGLYPKQTINFTIPDTISAALTKAVESEEIKLDMDIITLNPIVNPVKILRSNQHYEYESIYWWLLQSKTNPTTNIKVYESDEDPDEYLEKDTNKANDILQKIIHWLYKRLDWVASLEKTKDLGRFFAQPKIKKGLTLTHWKAVVDKKVTQKVVDAPTESRVGPNTPSKQEQYSYR